MTRAKARVAHRLGRNRQWGNHRQVADEVAVECGWGRLIFAHTFADNARLAEALHGEAPGRRDIAMYLRDPHVVLALAPHELFLDPSHTYRLWLSDYRPSRRRPRGFTIRRARTLDEAEAINRIYAARRMVPTDPAFVLEERNSRTVTVLVAVDDASGAVLGTATGVDHRQAFDDTEDGSSLWCLAVCPQASFPGIGEQLVRHLAERFQARGRAFMDLSVMHDNTQAIQLYEKLGFRRVPVFTVKRKNTLNERLFIGPEPEARLNPYARIIADEARRRGIGVEVVDEEAGYFTLTLGGRTITCRESLSELTSAVAMSRCDDKAVTRRVLLRAGLSVPDQADAGPPEADRAFLDRHRRVVVKPARGEQGAGISVDLSTPEEVAAAIAIARKVCDRVILEQFVEGHDLRIVVINHQVVAAAVRRPPRVLGDGALTVRQLIEKQSRRRAAATGGESHIPIDDETARCVRLEGWSLDDVPPAGTDVLVRKTANLHTGGTIHDVTEELHPDLAAAACRASRALDIPVVGFDFLVPDVSGPDYVIIEANERPGLANHEPRPTAERFVDLLFPQTAVS
ncbi:MAG: N-acetylglutaminylglutamine synthetase [Pseudomonadota bacterium]